jgi:hypothetical protein
MRDIAFDKVMVNTPNHAFERTGQQLRYWLPSSLRSSAAAQRERFGVGALQFGLARLEERWST